MTGTDLTHDEQRSSADAAEEKLSFGTKMAYGSGDLGTAIVAALKAFFLLFFLTDVARLSPAAAGSILLLTKFWDAVNDPFVGMISDRTITRWGRRRPWILIGAIPFGITFFMLWLVPNLSDSGKFVYYLIVAILLDSFYTVINVPYAALTPELTRDYDERTSLNSYRFAFSVAGALVAAALHPVIVGRFDDPQTGYMVAAAIWSVLSTIPCFIVVAGTRERPESVAPEARPAQIPVREQLRIAFSNRPYRFVIGIYLMSWLALQLVATVIIYYMTYYVGAPGQIPLVLFAIQGSAFVFLFIWSALSRRLEKRSVYMIGATVWIAVHIAIFTIAPGPSPWIVPLAALAGAGAAVAYLIPWAMMPDIIEFDEWETGQRREGVFYGFMVFLQKTGLALGIYLVGIGLEWAGYITPTDAVPTPVQPDGALTAIRWFMGPIPAVILVLSLALAYYYPITRQKHQAMRAALAARTAEAGAAD